MSSYWDSSEQWSASIEVCVCFCSGVSFPVCEFEFCLAFDKNPLKMFEFCPAFEKNPLKMFAFRPTFDKKFALDESQFSTDE